MAIRKALVAALKDNTDAKARVYEYSADPKRVAMPCLFVTFLGSEEEEWSQSPKRYKRNARWVIEVHHTMTDDLPDRLDTLAAQVEEVLHRPDFLAPIEVGGEEPYFERANIERVEVNLHDNAEQPFGELLIFFTLPYYEDLPAESSEIAQLLRTHLDWDFLEPDASTEATDDIEHVTNPGVWFDPEDLPAYASAAKLGGALEVESGRLTDYGSEVFDDIDANLPEPDEDDMPGTQQQWRRYGDRLFGMAGAYLLQSGRRKRSQMRQWITSAMDRLVSYELWGPTAEYDVDLAGAHITIGFATCYDVLHDDLSKKQRKRYRDAIRSQVEDFVTAHESGAGSYRWVEAYQGNINHMVFLAMLVGALAVRPRWPKWAASVIQHVRDNTQIAMDLREIRGEADFHEGPAYASLGLHGLLPTLELLKRHGFEDHTESEHLRDEIEGLFHTSALGFQKVIGYADNDTVFYHGPQHLLRWLGDKFDDGRAIWLADYLWSSAHGAQFPNGNPEGSTIFLEFLWRETDTEAVAIDTTNTPPFRHFEDGGLVSWRRGWAAGDSHAFFFAGNPTGANTWALALAGDPRLDVPGIAHIHPGAGQFMFWPGGSQLASGTLYEYPKRTALSNTVCFKPTVAIEPKVSDAELATLWEISAEQQVGRRDEVGQLGEWGQWFGPISELLADSYSVSVLDARSEDGGMFAIADIAGAYPDTVDLAAGGSAALPLDALRRSVLILPEDVAVVLDHVETSSALPYVGYWRLIQAPGVLETSIGVVGQVATMTSNGDAHTIEVAHPAAGLTIETGREIFSVEDATGVNDREVTDWDLLPSYSRFLRVEDPATDGAHDYVYVMTPDGVASSILSVDDTDPNGVTVRLTAGARTYQVKLATDMDPAARLAFLGDAEAYHKVVVE